MTLGEGASHNRLLVVDDERAFGDYIAKVAVSTGFEAVVASTAAEVWQRFGAFDPTVVILDLRMPEVDGVSLLRELAQRGCTARILISSAADDRTVRAAESLGSEYGLKVVGTVPKPVRIADLRTRLEALRSEAEPVTKAILEEAIQEGQLFLAYQPKLQVATGRIVGAEALARWRNRAGDVVHPEAFIPLIDKWELSDAFADWVLAHAIDEAGRWHQDGHPVHLAVNVSALNLHDLQLPDRIATACAECGLPPSALTLEVTETATMRDATRMTDVLTRFRLKGFHLAIDDFGTGYSSLKLLQRMPFSELKIDKSFVQAMDRSEDSATIVRAITELGHALGLSVVAEGVENEAILRMLAAARCDVAQGYFISRPFEGARLKAFAADWSMPAKPARTASHVRPADRLAEA